MQMRPHCVQTSVGKTHEYFYSCPLSTTCKIICLNEQIQLHLLWLLVSRIVQDFFFSVLK